MFGSASLRNARAWLLVPIALALGLAACTFGPGPRRLPSVVSFAPADCPVDISSIVLVDISCGSLTVPAHHDDPSRGTLKVFVTKMEPGLPSPASDPILYVGGDLGVAPDYTTLGSQVAVLDREVIVLETRGSGHSEPSLVCPELDAGGKPPVESRVDDPRTRAALLGALRGCRDRLLSQGVDLTAFDLREMAADADDLRIALGIDRWDVMALGTASRIALEYLRAYPDHVRAAVLDSPEWPGVSPSVESVQATRRAITALVGACSASISCRRFAPDLRSEIRAVTVRLDASPVEVDVSKVPAFGGEGKTGHVYFDAGWFFVWLRSRLAAIEPPGTFVPHAIAEFARGSDRVVRLEASRLVERQLCEGFLPSPCETQLVLSYGVYLSVMCRDVVPFTGGSDVERLVAGDPGSDEAYGHSPWLGACKVWDAGPGDETVATPVRSDVPTLVLVGRFDPFGMVSYAREATRSLRRSTVVVSPVDGRVVTGTDAMPNSCMVRIRDAWLDHPTFSPNTSCIARLHIDYALPLDWRL